MGAPSRASVARPLQRLAGKEPVMPTPTQNACDHPGCKCVVYSTELVQREEKVFCSERCADDRGCDHHDCNCGGFPTEEAAL
jgi:hypothetical protein